MQKSITQNLLWKAFERLGVSVVQFFLQLVLARLLSPSHYGALAIMIVFTTIANVFVQNGFNTALIQRKDLEEEDYSTVFWISLIIALVFYVIIFFFAPVIASFYSMPEIESPLRVLALMLFPGALNSVQVAKVSREMNFRKVFVCSICATVVSGTVGITLAALGGGLWALVAQTLINVTVSCIVMAAIVKLKLSFSCNLRRAKILFSFGWKLLLSSLIDTFWQDIEGLIIGKKYNSSTLGYYDKGKQLPKLVMNTINGTVQSVMLPAMSAEQDNKTRVKSMMHMSISVGSYIVFPIMAGLAAVATPLVRLLFTDKWLPSVPYLQVYCFTFAFYPFHSCNLQAMNAMGRSDLFLKLEIIKKSYGAIALIVAVFCFDSPLAIAMVGALSTFISCFVNAWSNKKLIGYSYFEQMKDIMPSFVASMVMFAVVFAIGRVVSWHIFPTLVLQILLGVIFYILISLLFRLQPFFYLLKMLKTLGNRES